MNYQNLFSRAWDLIWKNKFMILLGMLVSIGGYGGGNSASQGVNDGGGINIIPPDFDLSAPFQSYGIPLSVVILGGFFFLMLLAFWVVGTIARGGLIFGADTISRGQNSTFAESFRAGWEKGWQLLGIGVIPAIPILLLIPVAFLSLSFYQNNRIITEGTQSVGVPNVAVVIPIISVILLVFLVLSLLRTFANRACVLEGTGVFGSYRRGMEVLTSNLGSAIVLFLLQIVISIALGLLLFVPGILIALCCFLWPLLLIAQGAFAAFYSTLWTLAWNTWVGIPGDSVVVQESFGN